MRIYKQLIFVGINLILCKENIAQSTVKLEGTEYRMTLPAFYKIQKEQGIDYKIFHLLNTAATDSSKTFVEFGCCVGTIGDQLANAKKIDSVKQILLGHEARWTIYVWDSNYLAETLIFINDFEKAVFGIKTKKRKDVDLLIASFGTLSKKKVTAHNTRFAASLYRVGFTHK